jgi:hypothetical protein
MVPALIFYPYCSKFKVVVRVYQIIVNNDGYIVQVLCFRFAKGMERTAAKIEGKKGLNRVKNENSIMYISISASLGILTIIIVGLIVIFILIDYLYEVNLRI